MRNAIHKSIVLQLALALSSTSAFAEQVALSGVEIIDYLSGRSIKGNQDGMHWEQSFDKSGLTTYVQDRGRPSAGRWKAVDNKYCSQWPPSDRWDCYVFTADGEDLTFVPESGGAPWPARRLPVQ